MPRVRASELVSVIAIEGGATGRCSLARGPGCGRWWIRLLVPHISGPLGADRSNLSEDKAKINATFVYFSCFAFEVSGGLRRASSQSADRAPARRSQNVADANARW